MNILQICTKVPYPPKDGGAAAVYALSKSFFQLGHQIEILAVNPPKHFVSSDFLEHLPFPVHPVSVNTGVTFVGALFNLLFSKMPYHVQRFIATGFKRKLINLLSTGNYDIVQLEGIYLCVYIPVIRKHSKTKITLRAHNVEHRLWQDISGNEKGFLSRNYLQIQSKRIKNFEIKQLDMVDAVIAISENDENILRSLKETCKITTIPFGIDVKAIEIQDQGIINSVFYIGALDWLPNQEALGWFLNNVWPKVRNIFPSLEFHIAGRNASHQFSESLKKHKNVVFYGEVEDSSIFMKAHGLMVVPLFSGGGMRVKLIEAMNNGNVIVASDKACEGIPVVHGKHLRIAGSIDEFVDAIEIAIKRPEMNIPLLKNAKRLVKENFDNLVLTSKLVTFYQENLW